MNQQRLAELRRVIAEAPRDRFDMRDFTRVRADGVTTHCAAGWAALDDWFQRNTYISRVFRVERLSDDQSIVMPAARTMGVALPFGSLATIFQISLADSRAIFGEVAINFRRPIGKEEAMVNVDRLLSGRPAEPYRAEVA